MLSEVIKIKRIERMLSGLPQGTPTKEVYARNPKVGLSAGAHWITHLKHLHEGIGGAQ